MVLSRVLRFFLILALVGLAIVSCILFSPAGSKGVRPGRGEDSPLAKALEKGKLNQHLPQEEAEAPAMRPGPAAPTLVGVLTLEAEEAEEEEEMEEEMDTKVSFGEEGVAGVPAKETGEKKPTTGRWQRSKQRPSFARVYVGDGNALKLERMRVTVTIEGPRARTVVDHIFRNPHDRQLEGTFEYPLPASASPSYYAMFLTAQQEEVPDFFPQGVFAAMPAGALADMGPADAIRQVSKSEWGELREARVVHKEKARRTYEEITRRQIDPALLEYAGGNTFRGRVFPIQPQGLNRVIVAYEELLDVVEGAVQYRFPLPDCELDLLHLTLVVDQGEVKEGGDALVPEGAARRVRDGKIVYEHAWETGKGPGGTLVLAMTPRDGQVQTTSGKERSFYARVRPDLPVREGKPYAERAVFLLDTSFSEEPDRFNANLKILEQILKSDGDIKQFNVVCFDVGAAWVEPGGWVANDKRGRRKVRDRLQDVLLKGATDLGAAIDLLDETSWPSTADDPVPGYVFLLTDGQVNWGERSADVLSRSLESCRLIKPRVFCYRTGISAENLELFRKLTRRGGGIFNVFTEAMASKVGRAHRRPAFLVKDVLVPGAQDLLLAGRQAAVFPGGEIVIAGKWESGNEPPQELILRGSFQGEEKSYRFPLQLDQKGSLAARAWAEIAVNQMLALDDRKYEALATAYAQRYHIGSRVTSFLVLEQDSDYEEYDIRKEASELEVEDMAQFLDARYSDRPERRSRKQAFRAFLESRGPEFEQARPGRLLELLHEQDFQLPPGPHGGVILGRKDVSGEYLAARSKSRKRVQVYVQEAARRLVDKRERAGIKVLSTVVEMHPGRSDAMRLVGYRLMSLGQSGHAAQLFDSVRLERPFEPHSYRDLARSLELSYRYPLAALQYEILMAGKWHERFGDSLKVVVQEEYAHTLRAGLRSGGLSSDLIAYFESRSQELRGGKEKDQPVDLRVTISWNTDNTDVDLWVVEPSGEACGYSHTETKGGGRLLDDLTGGYGPERYAIGKAPVGEYVVLVKYYSANPNLIAGETHVDVVVEHRPGTREEEVHRFQVILTREEQAYEVCRVGL